MLMRMSLGPPGALGAHPVCALPVATRQDAEPVIHNVASGVLSQESVLQ